MTLFRRMRTKAHVGAFALIVAFFGNAFAAALSVLMMDHGDFVKAWPVNLFVGTSVALIIAGFVGAQLVSINSLTSEMDRMASFDYLTGAETRRKFFDHFNQERTKFGAVIVFDMDGFKQINDTLGHAAGDQALVVVADTIKGQIGSKDHLCRMGGDEFCVFLDGVDQLSANRIAARIKRKLVEQIVGDINMGLRLHASAGIATFNLGDDIDEVIATADKALFVQKSSLRIGRPMAFR